MKHIIDLILAAFILLIVFASARRGLIRTVFDVASGIIAFLAAQIFSPYASEYIYGSYVREKVIAFLNGQMQKAEQGLANALTEAGGIFDFLPNGAKTLVGFSADFEPSQIAENLLNGTISVSQVEAEFVAPMLTVLIKLVSFAVISSAALVVLRFASYFIAKVVKSTKLTDRMDTVLGGVFGLLKGGIYSLIAAALIQVASCFSTTLAYYAADSYICSFVGNFIGL